MDEVNELNRLLAAERAKTVNLAQALARTVERVIELEDRLERGERGDRPWEWLADRIDVQRERLRQSTAVCEQRRG